MVQAVEVQAERLAHQPPRVRCIRLRQNRGDLAREAVVLHARVGRLVGSYYVLSSCTFPSHLGRIPFLVTRACMYVDLVFISLGVDVLKTELGT